jgi:hypothetical protein
MGNTKSQIDHLEDMSTGHGSTHFHFSLSATKVQNLDHERVTVAVEYEVYTRTHGVAMKFLECLR